MVQEIKPAVTYCLTVTNANSFIFKYTSFQANFQGYRYEYNSVPGHTPEKKNVINHNASTLNPISGVCIFKIFNLMFVSGIRNVQGVASCFHKSPVEEVIEYTTKITSITCVRLD